MSRKYRALVVFLAVAAVLTTSAVTYAGVRMFDAVLDEPVVSRAFSWRIGAYQVDGCIDRGILKEMHVLLTEE